MFESVLRVSYTHCTEIRETPVHRNSIANRFGTSLQHQPTTMQQQMQVVIPQGISPGMAFQVNTPAGMMQARAAQNACQRKMSGRRTRMEAEPAPCFLAGDLP